MTGVATIASATLTRSIRSRSFLVLGILAPLAIMSALSATIGDALAGEYRPSLTIVDPTGGAATSGLVAGLLASGFDDIDVVDDVETARMSVTEGGTDAAVVVPAGWPTNVAPEDAFVVFANGNQPLAADAANAIASQLAQAATTQSALAIVGGPTQEPANALQLVVDDDVGTLVLTDSTYFAVGMSSFFAIFAAVGFTTSYHRERSQATLARMLTAPVSRAAPITGTAIGVAIVTAVSMLVLIIASTTMLEANWGPMAGTTLIASATVFTAVAVAVAVVAMTKSESAATQAGMVLATAWAVFGGVFVEIPTSGPLATGAKFSPFTWALDGIGHNAGGAGLDRVAAHAAVIAAFGLAALIVVLTRRRQLMRA